MKRLSYAALFFLLLLLASATLASPLERGRPFPRLIGVDVKGRTVDTAQTADDLPPTQLLLVLFFQVGAGEDMANKIRSLDERFGDDLIRCMAVGIDESPESLRNFSDRMGISYPMVPSHSVLEAGWLKELHTLPLCVFVDPHANHAITRIISGSGTAQSALLTEVAEQLFEQRRAQAIEAVKLALENGEPKAPALEIMGYHYVETGNYEAAETAFSSADSDTGKAALALARGDVLGAQELATRATDPFAKTLLAESLFMQHKWEEAEALLNNPSPMDDDAWKLSRRHELKGRLASETGKDLSEALQHLETATRVNPYNTSAAGNESLLLEQRGGPGDLERAEAILRQAVNRGDDPVAALLLKELVERRNAEANAQRVAELHAQIRQLSARYNELEINGSKRIAEPWTSPPLRVALLEEDPAGTVFPRAGYGRLLMQELRRQLSQSGSIEVLSRELLQPLLSEIQLDYDHLQDPSRQYLLGETLTASHLGFVDYVLAGGERRVYLRLIDAGTSEIAFQTSAPVNLRDPLACIQGLVEEAQRDFVRSRPLKGQITEMLSADLAVINLGARHGVSLGDRFVVLQSSEEKPDIHSKSPSSMRQIGRIEVTEVTDFSAHCSVRVLRDGETLSKESLIAKE